MPYTPKAMRFFQLCKHSRGKAVKKCPPPKALKKMISHGVKK